MKLHYSQTESQIYNSPDKFQYLMKLHYSQTKEIIFIISKIVSVPYEITLLSNNTLIFRLKKLVSVPYEITLLSNLAICVKEYQRFQYLMKLHYSQTSNKLRHYNAQGNNIRYIYYTI